MSKHVYAAVLESEEGAYNVEFPDLEGCYTCGDDLPDVMRMAYDALHGYLARMEEKGLSVPSATDPERLSVPEKSIVAVIAVDTTKYCEVIMSSGNVARVRKHGTDFCIDIPDLPGTHAQCKKWREIPKEAEWSLSSFLEAAKAVGEEVSGPSCDFELAEGEWVTIVAV